MYKLPETVDDFNSKYRGCICYVLSTQKDKEVGIPVLIQGVVSDRGELALAGYRPVEGQDDWLNFIMRLSLIDDIIFHLPEPGYYLPSNSLPVYVDRAPVKSVARGWNRSSVSLEIPFPFDKYNVKGLTRIQSADDVRLVRQVFKGQEYISVKDLANHKMAVLGPDFLAMKATEEDWALYYQNYIIGSINVKTQQVDFKVQDISELYYSQVV